MVELKQDELMFSFPEVHAAAVLRVSFQRTLRIPDDDRTYPLPPGLGRFPLRHVDDFGERTPEHWSRRGGVALPMYQSEALWLHFDSPNRYPFAVKVAAGKINAVTGDGWKEGLSREPQDYLAIPPQPWLDGFCVRKGVIRQFVAMPLGSGYSVEEQLSGAAEHGGIQLLVHPLERRAYRPLRMRMSDSGLTTTLCFAPLEDMGLAAGGSMEQEIYEDTQELSNWDLEHRARCFVHLANSLAWRSITGEEPPTVPFTAREYTKAGLPWFEYYAEGQNSLPGGKLLEKIRSITQIGQSKGDPPLPENESVSPINVVKIRAGLQRDEVREGVS